MWKPSKPDAPARTKYLGLSTIKWQVRQGEHETLKDCGSLPLWTSIQGMSTSLARRMLWQNLGYFRRHREHLNYAEYRKLGWLIGSGIVESGVKQFNKRVEGTEQS